MSTTPTVASFLNTHQNHRQGMIPSPAGTLPQARRRRRGMVSLAAWDAAAAAHDSAAGITPTKAPGVSLLQMIAGTVDTDSLEALIPEGRAGIDAPPEGQAPAPISAAAPDAIAPAGFPTPEAPAPETHPRPRDPEADDENVDAPAGAPGTTKGALLEDQMPTGPATVVNLPAPTPEGIAAAKALLAAESGSPAATEPQAPTGPVPPPPTAKPAKKNAKTPAN